MAEQRELCVSVAEGAALTDTLHRAGHRLERGGHGDCPLDD